MKRQFIKCTGVSYRQGFVEVVAGIHPKHINLETWNVNSDAKLSGTPGSLPEGSITANTELELDLKQVKALIAALEAAVQIISRGENNELTSIST
jgi:hypothetical protein